MELSAQTVVFGGSEVREAILLQPLAPIFAKLFPISPWRDESASDNSLFLFLVTAVVNVDPQKHGKRYIRSCEVLGV